MADHTDVPPTATSADRTSFGATDAFHGDRPIRHADEDRFVLSELAGRLAGALLEQPAERGFVLGIEGRWGSGKSSLLALVLDHVRRSTKHPAEVVEFSPWLIGDRDQLLADLFDELARAIAAGERAGGDATRTTTMAATDVAAKLRGYARRLTPVGRLVGLAGLAVPGLGAVGSAMEALAGAAAEPDELPLAKRRDDIADAMSKLERRIVVAIDDVDRLEPSEVAELLRLVRSVADFPNVTYVLCYDAAALATSIQTALKLDDGRAFLEKIVQVQISVPRPESFALRHLFSSELSKFAQCDGDAGRRLAQVIDETGGRSFDTPRTVMRVLDSIRLLWPTLSGRVDLADLVWLRIVAISSPHLFRWVEDYLDAIASVATGRAQVANAESRSFGNRLDVALTADGLTWEGMMRELHQVLPRMGHGTGPAGEADGRLFAHDRLAGVPEAVRHRRLASPDHSRLYFALARPPGSVDLEDIEQLLAAARASEGEAIELFGVMLRERNVSGSTKAERMIDQLRNLTPEALAATDFCNLARAIAAVAIELARSHEEEWGQPKAYREAWQVLKIIKLAASVEQWRSLLLDLATIPQLDFLTHMLREDTFNLGIYGGRPDQRDALLDRADYDLFRDAIATRSWRGTRRWASKG